MILTLMAIVTFFKISSSSNILIVDTVPSKSHHLWAKSLAMGLIERGHNITILTIQPDQNRKNYTVIYMQVPNIQNLGKTNLVNHGIIESFRAFANVHFSILIPAFKSNGYRKLLSYSKDFFDVIIFDVSMGRFWLHLIEVFKNPPAIGFTPFLLPSYLYSSFASYPSTAYNPHYASGFSSFMTFKERILNYYYIYLNIIFVEFAFYPQENALLVQNVKTHLSTAELERKISILLSNIDPVFDYPRELPPNIIPVGGLHAKPAKPLPKDLQEVINKAEHGVILFSLGTNLRSDYLTPQTINYFLQAFSKLPHTVIWKFESNVTNFPKNVILKTWLPQNDILGHPNVKLFITHGGALSTQEAFYHGVPMVGIPFYADQLNNMRHVVDKKIGKRLDIFNLTLENIEEALNEVLGSKKYLINVKRLSTMYKDQPQTALERAVFWIEYVLRHGDAEHLVASSRDMSFYQIASLDVFATFLVCCGGTGLIIFLLLGCYQKLLKLRLWKQIKPKLL